MLTNVLWIIVWGGIGSACRYLLSTMATKWFGSGLAWGTLGVNLIGCFLIGLAYSLIERHLLPPSSRVIFMTGFVGGLTTFSAYALDSVNYFRNAEFVAGFLNLAVNNFGGLLLVLVGIWVGRL